MELRQESIIGQGIKISTTIDNFSDWDKKKITLKR
jgi:hypothetical protein